MLCNDDWLVHKSVEVNEYLVKAKLTSRRRRSPEASDPAA